MKTTNRVIRVPRRVVQPKPKIKKFKRPFRVMSDRLIKLHKKSRGGRPRIDNTTCPGLSKQERQKIRKGMAKKDRSKQIHSDADAFFDQDEPYTPAQMNEFNRRSRP